ncbi:MAG: hypothetical protein DWQ01_04410 [Planctomycetota bacterium]|nr:MAG: hypothetical protein DWQ01_04410 [Planctomycetota bacterium]
MKVLFRNDPAIRRLPIYFVLSLFFSPLQAWFGLKMVGGPMDDSVLLQSLLLRNFFMMAVFIPWMSLWASIGFFYRAQPWLLALPVRNIDLLRSRLSAQFIALGLPVLTAFVSFRLILPIEATPWIHDVAVNLFGSLSCFLVLSQDRAGNDHRAPYGEALWPWIVAAITLLTASMMVPGPWLGLIFLAVAWWRFQALKKQLLPAAQLQCLHRRSAKKKESRAAAGEFRGERLDGGKILRRYLRRHTIYYPVFVIECVAILLFAFLFFVRGGFATHVIFLYWFLGFTALMGLNLRRKVGFWPLDPRKIADSVLLPPLLCFVLAFLLAMLVGVDRGRMALPRVDTEIIRVKQKDGKDKFFDQIVIPGGFRKFCLPGTVAEIKSPWGESVQPKVTSLIPGLLGSYNPYEVYLGASRDFLAWQGARAVSEIHGVSVNYKQFATDHVEIKSWGEARFLDTAFEVEHLLPKINSQIWFSSRQAALLAVYLMGWFGTIYLLWFRNRPPADRNKMVLYFVPWIVLASFWILVAWANFQIIGGEPGSAAAMLVDFPFLVSEFLFPENRILAWLILILISALGYRTLRERFAGLEVPPSGGPHAAALNKGILASYMKI